MSTLYCVDDVSSLARPVFGLVLFLLGSSVNQAAAQSSFTVSPIGVTSTQSILAYAAPIDGACGIQVSESANYTPLVHDVDSNLFPQSNLDSRQGSLVSGRSRVVVIGKRMAERAADGTTYSRALQTNTLHYYKVTCGAAVSSGTFTTANIPLGMTYSDLPQVDPANPGAYLVPTPPALRSSVVVDPHTGALIKPLSLLEDHPNDTGAFLAWGGFVRMCGTTLVGPGPGFLCGMYNGEGGWGLIYYVIPSTGEVRYLGTHASAYPLFDGADNKIYQVTTIGSQTVITRDTYTGNYQPATNTQWAAVYSETFYAGSPGDLIKQFNPAFDPARFGCGISVKGQYALFTCRASGQDSYGWQAILDMGNRLPIGSCGADPQKCPHMVAAAQIYSSPATRWCGLHNSQLFEDAPLAVITPQRLNGPDGQVGVGPYTSTLSGSVSATQTVFTVSGEPHSLSTVDGYIGDAQAGDLFMFADTAELVKIVAKTGSTSWQVQRGYGGYYQPVAHSSGAALRAYCSADYHQVYWKFLSDPYGLDQTGTYLVADYYWPAGGHDDWGPNLRLTEDYNAVQGPLLDKINTPISFRMTSAPSFAGAASRAEGASYDKHPSYHQSKASPQDQTWFLDMLGLVGGNLFSPVPGATPVSGQLYKYLFDSFVTGIGNRKALATLAVSGTSALRDISGPSAVIGDGADFSYTYCVARVAGECRSGSAPGDVFANVPNLQYLYCAGSHTARDLCITPFAMYGSAVVQLGLTSNSVGVPAGGSVNGAGFSRVLTQGLTGPRQMWDYPTAKALPDGSWAMFGLHRDATSTVMMLKLPPYQQPDGRDRSEFLPLTVNLTPPADPRISRAVVEFGYAEQGSPDAHFCTSRREVCVAASATLNLADRLNPFQYLLTDTYSGVACAGSCQVTIPVLPMHVTYYQARYLDSAGQLVTLGERGVSAELAAALVMVPPPPTGTSIWSSSTVPSIPWYNDAPVTLGVKFRSDVSGSATGIRFYKGAGNNGTHIGLLYSSTGTPLAQATFTSETASGWQQVNFSSAVSIAANTTYIAAFFSTSGFAYAPDYFTSSGTDSPPLHALRSGVDGPNSVYMYGGAPQFPSSTYGDANYWVDIAFSAGGSPPPPTPTSLWSSSTVPSTPWYNDAPATLGVKFRSDVSGSVTGIRFYKGAGNNGTHIGLFYSSTGTLLAQATFTSETAAGWQQVNFSSAVSIAANTTYIAAFFSPSGFALNTNYFTSSGTDSPPLHALRSGVDGPNSVYVYAGAPQFPSSSYADSNYWVDLLFTAN